MSWTKSCLWTYSFIDYSCALLADRYTKFDGSRADKNKSRVKQVLNLSYICRLFGGFFYVNYGRIIGNSTFDDSTMFVDNKYRTEPRETSNKQNLILICHISFSRDNEYRKNTILKDETDIFANITASPIGQPGMLTNVYVKTFKIYNIVFFGKFTMHLTSHWSTISASDSVCDKDMTVATWGAVPAYPSGAHAFTPILVVFVLFDL